MISHAGDKLEFNMSSNNGSRSKLMSQN
uniref:Uncharacterized protein n=1 Tax=Rhizophora mucronata TaxID=61149 RepID=A0A2P2PZ18_RHIMU